MKIILHNRRNSLLASAIAAMLACGCTTMVERTFVPMEKSSKAIQRAIDMANAAGGGVVQLLPGVYPSGTLYLKSNVELNLAEGAVILGAGSPDAYDDVDDPRIGKKPEKSTKVFIACLDGTNVTISGKGVIDGNGPKFYDPSTLQWGRFYAKPPHPRTRMLEFFNCRNVRLEDVTFKDSPGWTCWARMCENFTAERVKVTADQKMINNDGFHMDGCRHTVIRNCRLQTGDDCIVMRAIRSPNGDSELNEDMLVEDCELDSACQCIRLGCPSDGTIRNGVFRRLKMRGNNGVVSGHPVRYLQEGLHGGFAMRDIMIEDCDIDVGGSAISFWVEKGVELAEYGNVTFRNLTVRSAKPINLQGTGNSVLKNLRFENVRGKVEAAAAVTMESTENVVFERFEVSSGAGERVAPANNQSDTWERVR